MTAITILASRVEEAVASVAKANRKLEKAGIVERFELTIGEFFVKTYTYNGVTEHLNKVEIELNTPEISFGGFVFVATLVDETGDLITRVAPGQDLKGYAPKEAVCDHCGIVRQRNKTYIVRDADGKISQVGSSCIKLFLGVSPANLWALDFELDTNELNQDREGGFSRSDRAYDVRYLVALSYVITDGGLGYRSNASTEFGGISTATKVWNVLNGSQPRETYEERAARQATIEAAQALSQSVVDEVLAVASTLDQNTDYGHNLAVLAGKEFVSAKSVGILISIVAAYAREARKVAQAAAKAAQIAAGEVSEAPEGKVTVIGTIVSLKLVEGFGYGAPDVLKMLVESDKGYKVWATVPASIRDEVEQGTRVQFNATLAVKGADKFFAIGTRPTQAKIAA